MDRYDDRSSDESDAGSLEDFIVDSGDESAHGTESDEDSEQLGIDRSNIIETSVFENGLRRSRRRRRAPERYIDDQYAQLMTEDIGSDREMLLLSDDEEEGSGAPPSDDDYVQGDREADADDEEDSLTDTSDLSVASSLATAAASPPVLC